MGREEGKRSLLSNAWFVILWRGRVTRWETWIGSAPLYTICVSCSAKCGAHETAHGGDGRLRPSTREERVVTRDGERVSGVCQRIRDDHREMNEEEMMESES
jgi:hypothetical protein